MIYDHTVKHNGKYYAAGEEVPENDNPLFVNKSEEKNNISDIDGVSSLKTSKRGRPRKLE